MKQKRTFLLFFMLIITMINIIFTINTYNINKQRGYYTARIESMNQKNGITTIEVSPVSSNRYFISEIKENHQIEYVTDNINIAGISDPRKNSRRVKMGELGEMVNKLKVGDNIIFKVEDKDYDKNEYNLEIDELAVDLTLE